MFAHILKNRLFMGAFAFFVLCVVGSLLYLRHVEQQTTRELAETKARVMQYTEPQNQQPSPEAPIGETESQQDGHFHADGTWHEGPHEPVSVAEPPPPDFATPAQPVSVEPYVGTDPPFDDPYLQMVDGFTVTSQFALMMAPKGVGPNWAAMSAEELSAAIDTLNRTHGMPPPPDDDLWAPEGYNYAIGGTNSFSNGGRNVWLDDNGHPIIRKRNSPFFDIAWVEGFRPPPDVYADYKALDKQYISALINEMPEEAARLAAEQEAIEAMYRGRIPSGPFSGGNIPPGMEVWQYFRQFQGIQKQLLRNAYESEGIGYLMDRYSALKPYARLDRYPELKEFTK